MKPTKQEIPYAVYGTWEVWQDGTLKSTYTNPSGRQSNVSIYPESLADADLFLSLYAGKIVTDWNDFLPAFLKACELSGTKSIPNFQTTFE